MGTLLRLETVDPTATDLSDLEPLRRMVGNAQVVGLGEATHGSAEFFRAKHRIFEFLVGHMGFTALAVEAILPESFDVDDYLQTGRGDPVRALGGLYFWNLNNQEVLDLILWMRKWNEDPTHRRKLHFYGVDIQFPTRALRLATEYLTGVDSKFAVPSSLKIMANAFDWNRLSISSNEQKQSMLAAARTLVETLDRRHSELVAKTTEEARSRARRFAALVPQYLEMISSPNGGAIRDQYMAENFEWILNREGLNGRVALWAHNGHVARSPEGEDQSLGARVRTKLGDRYRSIGFVMGEGRFQSLDLTNGIGRGVHAFEVAMAPVGSLDETLARVGLALLIIDLHAVPTKGVVSDWFRVPHLSRSVGGIFSETWPSVATMTNDTIVERYDGLVFVRRVTESRQLESASSRRVRHSRRLRISDSRAD
ncbi:MAG: uncharacterized protein JWM53_2662 [bacterium]|nr:uncharacterized protein [bacterium]